MSVMQTLAGEMHLATDLKRHRIQLFDGLQTTIQRKERARQAILSHDLTYRFASHNETFIDAFERVYGELLVPQQKVGT